MAEKLHVVRNQKDTVFRMLFREKKELLELYNALNDSAYNSPEDLTICTLENAIYMNFKNDISFLLDSEMNLYEHQGCLLYTSGQGYHDRASRHLYFHRAI